MVQPSPRRGAPHRSLAAAARALLALAIGVAVVAALRAPAAMAQELPPMSLDVALTGLDRPLYVTHAGDSTGDLYIVEKPGRIRVARDGVVQPEPFLDIRLKVRSTGSEQGLLGLAFHPRYAENGYFYVNYTNLEGDTVVERYTASPDGLTADPASAWPLLTIDQPFANHNGGSLVFGPDGYLWIGTGDGGSAGDPYGNAQNLESLLGKLLRIDVDSGDPYGIPSDNPFVAAPPARPEIWAYGLRNPWRFSFDRETGDLYIGDVGQNAWEEINFSLADVPGGLNFGWNLMEGMHCYPAGTECDSFGLAQPIVEYPTGDEGCAVTGGYVYRGQQFPALQGTYFFTDFCGATIWALEWHPDTGWVRTVAIDPPAGSPGFSSLGEDEFGELYVTALNRGIVYRLVQSAP